MTKADLIDEVSRLAELTRKDSEVIVETIFDSVVRSLRVGDKIEIRGFGSFRTRQRKPRVGRNPKTGERVEVPAKKIPFFKPSKELKDLVNTGVPASGAVRDPGRPASRAVKPRPGQCRKQQPATPSGKVHPQDNISISWSSLVGLAPRSARASPAANQNRRTRSADEIRASGFSWRSGQPVSLAPDSDDRHHPSSDSLLGAIGEQQIGPAGSTKRRLRNVVCPDSRARAAGADWLRPDPEKSSWGVRRGRERGR